MELTFRVKFMIFLISVCVLSSVVSTEKFFDDDEADVVDDFDSSDPKVVKEEILHEVLYVSPKPSGPVYFSEHFDSEADFAKNWIKSSAKKDGVDDDIAKYDGLWGLESLERDPLDGDMGLVLKSKAKHAAISSKLNRPFSFAAGKPFVIQYEVAFQRGMECGGAYMKLISDQKHLDLNLFHDKTKYSIMFGPDKCGNDYKLHFIFQHRNPKNGTYAEKHAKRPNSKIEELFKDKKPHLFTLILNPDSTFEVLVDNEIANSGSLLVDFDPPVNPPKEIDDPSDSKPEDWDEREKIPDPVATKPDDWDENAPRHVPDEKAVKPDGWLDDEEEMVPDPEAKKPDDWDEEMDGAWEAPLINNPVCDTAPGCGKWTPPMVDNPSYRGKWYPPMIDNPAYKGKWSPRKVANPDYFEDLEPFKMDDIGAVGFELWSMSDGVYFDNIVVTSDKKVAEDYARDTFQLKLEKQDAGEAISKYRSGDLEASLEEEAQDTWFRRLVRFTNKNPWMWAVIVVVVGLPFVLILTFCCGTTSDKTAEGVAAAKKTDAASKDDEVEEEQGDAENEALLQKSKIKKDDLEDAAEESEAEEEEEEEQDEEEEALEEKGGGDKNPLVGNSGSPRRRRTRKE
ncbi:unnamed protein product [Notodromas monacha]|uniref:Calnexin n=1 Tax=Notodromas monacha TaxID=399045 RepID=A0A7R9BM50_9CRUS|nr:unnamed protein product [Notodromas monacha]CAG0916679.1 unnamed protein product [Notodromas monacha]